MFSFLRKKPKPRPHAASDEEFLEQCSQKAGHESFGEFMHDGHSKFMQQNAGGATPLDSQLEEQQQAISQGISVDKPGDLVTKAAPTMSPTEKQVYRSSIGGGMRGSLERLR